MKTLMWRLLAVAVIMISYVAYAHPDWIVDPPSFLATAYAESKAGTGNCAGYPNGICESCTIGQCGGKDATPPNPQRPYFDGFGNEFDYQGNLIQAAPCSTNPINGQSNPYSCNTQPQTQDQQSQTASDFTGK